MTPHYTGRSPLLIGREEGEEASQESLANSGMADVPAGARLHLLIPAGKGVNPSFFEGFLLSFARDTIFSRPELKLSELVTLARTPEDSPEKRRFDQSVSNLNAALYSLEYFWTQKQKRKLVKAV